MERVTQLAAALSSDSRLTIFKWLKEPTTHFPPQEQADREKDGVCGAFIAHKLGVSAPTASEHLKILVNAGLVESKRLGKWTYFRRTEHGLQDFIDLLAVL